MGKIKIYILGAFIAFMLIIIPVTVIGSIIESPLDYLGSLLFDAGDTSSVSSEIEDMYGEFLSSDTGKEIIGYINKKNMDYENIYFSTYYTLPLLIITEERANAEDKFEYKDKIDILFNLRYESETDDDYIRAIKKNSSFSKLNKLSDTVIMMYINHFKGSGSFGDTGYTVVGDSEIGKKIAQVALSRVGCPYYWGGGHGSQYKDPSLGLFDCSGLVNWAFYHSGIDIGSTGTYLQSEMGVSVPRNELQAGDIILLMTDGYSPSHVAIYIGNGMMIHASGEGSTCLGNHAAQGHVVKVVNYTDNTYWQSITYDCRRLY